MRFRLDIRTFLLWSSALLVSACSVNLVQGDMDHGTAASAAETRPDSVPLFNNIPLTIGSDTLWLSKGLLNEYNRAAPLDIYPRERCNGTANIQAQVTQNAEPDPLSLPLLIIPFWPVTPVDETWTYTLKLQILCDGVLVKRVEYKEEETIRAGLYGKLRSDLLNNASKDMHRKLIRRLAFELNYQLNADMGSRSDY